METSNFDSVLVLVIMGVLAPAVEEIPPPTVYNDGRVRFRRSAPDADKVALLFEGRNPIPMTKGEDGV